MTNEFRKIPQNQRNYIKYVDATGKATYIYASEDESLRTDVTIYREDGTYEVAKSVVEEYHRSRDRWVESNIRNHKVYLTDEQKAVVAAWKKNHPGEAVKGLWALSLEGMSSQTDDGDDISSDHSSLMAEAVAYMEEPEKSEVDRLHELIEGMEQIDQIIFQLVVKEELSNRKAAKELGMTEGSIRYHMKKIQEAIAADTKLKKIWKNF